MADGWRLTRSSGGWLLPSVSAGAESTAGAPAVPRSGNARSVWPNSAATIAKLGFCVPKPSSGPQSDKVAGGLRRLSAHVR